MGKGKGGFHKFVHRASCLSPIFLLHNVSLVCAARVMQQIEHKLPIKLCIFSVKYLINSDNILPSDNSAFAPYEFIDNYAYRHRN
jgi:hypothetical protein